ncbi:glycosyltransferase family 4 protein [Gemelliphila palaticanis]|uniref:Glycosyltransferase family 4 protein n=1 Tax=Gemelliphila palaticanis TaxID=81950 RepID=A0ABX2SZL0_9BACL|nr:glycosyltransferase family 4 protein [Gemella palaticanis]MBF0715597.1 glycosyltransferase family 4 protein [Gemella palaticanis]NYS47527.1 glycosyltransferase family 4 protein [Gemella palaticanis]
MKKICLLKWSIANYDGGAKVAVNLSNELSKKYKVYLVSINPVSEIKFRIDDNVEVGQLFDKKVYQRNIISIALNLRKFIKTNKIDIIMNIGLAPNIVLTLATLFFNVKKVFCEHTNLKFELDSKITRFQRYVATRYFDKIVVLTDQDKNYYIEKYNINDKIIRIYNWIDSDENFHTYNIKSKKIVTVGRFTKQKGYDFLSEIAINVLSRKKDWQWEIYGLGDEKIKDNLISKFKDYQISNQVVFKGVTNNIYDIYNNKSIYAMTSRYEGLPLVLLEAKKFKIPIISFDCPTGPRELIINNENGFLINSYNIDNYSDKLLELIDNEFLRMSMSNKSLLDTNKFEKDIILEHWIDLIDNL